MKALRQIEFAGDPSSDAAGHEFGQRQSDAQLGCVNDRNPASDHRSISFTRYIVGGSNAALGEQATGTIASSASKASRDGAWTAHGGSYTSTAEFGRKRFGEGQHKSLGSVVRRHERPGLIASRRADVEHTATLPRDHAGQQPPREVNERGDVNRDLVQLFLRVELPEGAVAANPSVVNQPLDLKVAGLQRSEDACANAGLTQISRQNLNGYTARTKFVRDLFEDVLAAGNQDQIMPVLGELASQREPQATGSASDKCVSHDPPYHCKAVRALASHFNYDRSMSYDPRNPWGPPMPGQPQPPVQSGPAHAQPQPAQPVYGQPAHAGPPVAAQQPYPPPPYAQPQQPYPPPPYAQPQPGQPVPAQPMYAQAAQQPIAPSARKTHLISTVNAPKGSGFAAMAALSLRRAFRLRIEPNEVLDDERTAMLRSTPPITDENQQAFLAWRRSVLFMAALLMVPVALLHAIDKLDFNDSIPDGWKTVNTVAFLVEAGFAGFLWMQVPKWTGWRKQSRALSIGWLLYFFTPFLVYLYPLAEAMVEMQTRGADASNVPPEALQQVRVAAGALIGASALVSLAPKVISLLQGVIRASIATKTLFPGSTAPGWTMVVAAPLYMVIFYIFVLLPYHFSGSGLVALGLVLVLGAKATLVRAGLGLTKPMTDSVARAATSKALTMWMALLVAGAAAIIAGLWDIIEQASALAVVNFALSMGANILVLTVIATDGLISALNRARGTTPDEEKLADQAAAQVASFTREGA